MAYLQHPDTQSTAKRITLAVNGPKKCPIWEKILDSLPPFLMLFVVIMMIFVIVTTAKQNDADLIIWTFYTTAFLFCLYMFLFVLDNHIRLFHAQETISIQGDALVIDCIKSFMRRHKSIPLSSIRRVDHYDGSRGSSLTVPDTLRVYYGRHSRYRFAINMTYSDSSQLAKEIMKFVHK